MPTTQNPHQSQETPQFSSRLGFILATVGSAVGVGNLWRFPYLLGSNGGAAFLVAYLLVVAVFALPLLILELSIGKSTGRGVVGAFAALASRWKALGLLVMAGVGLLLSYYLVVTGWALGYLVHATAGLHPRFADYIAGYNSVWWFLAVSLIAMLIVWRGVARGIEAANKVLMPILLIAIVGLAVYGAFLPGWGPAMEFYLMPDLSSLGQANVWALAIGQAFFSVGVGMGVMITYGSYMKRASGVFSSSVYVVIADTGIAILAGLMIFPIVFSFGGTQAAGPQLAFDTLPTVFGHLGSVTGRVVGAAFYLGLVAAALSSAVSLLETVVAGLSEQTGMRRDRALLVSATVITLLGLPSALSYARPALSIFDTLVFDAMDIVVGTVGLTVGAFLTALVFGWTGKPALMETLGPGWKGKLVLWSVRLLVPAAILAVLTAMGLDVLVRRVAPEGG